MATPLLRTALLRNAKRVAATSAASSSPSRPHRGHHSHKSISKSASPSTSQTTSSSPYRSRPITRSLFSWAKQAEDNASSPVPEPFHSFSKSPHADLRERAMRISHMAPCPVCLTKSQVHRRASYDCLDCGYPTHCSKEHWEQDAEHAKYCDRLRDSNDDEHYLRSGKRIWEFEMNTFQAWDEAVSLANWDMFWYTRGFPSMDSERSRRLASKMLTYTVTIASVLHEHGPHSTKNQRITSEGARSLAALRSNLHTTANMELSPLDKAERPPIRIFILGARSESNLPADMWQQIGCLFPSTTFHIYLIGPEASQPETKSPNKFNPPPPPKMEKGIIPQTQQLVMPKSMPMHPLNSSIKPYVRDQSKKYGFPAYSAPCSQNVRVIGIQAHYHDVHAQFGPFDPYSDVFFSFSPGFGFPSTSNPPLTQIASPSEWGLDIPQILDTKCSLFVTGFSPTDVERDVRSLDSVEGIQGEYDWVMTPGVNPFGSERWDILESDPRVMIKTNWGIWGIKGKSRDIREGYDNDVEMVEAEEDKDRYIGSPR